MVKALNLAAKGEVDAVVSSGSTGALLAGATLIVKRIKGVKRPALSPLLPTVKGGWIMLIDCGANTDCKPQYLQQFGVMYTTVGKAGFITTLYIAFVPIISIFMRKRVRPIMWLCVLLGAVGFYLLCMTEASLKLEFGDMLVLLCAAAFAIHIQIIDYYSPKGDGIKISCVQFLFAGVLGLICMAIFETPDLGNILACWLPILYAGVLSCGIGYTLQVVAQADADPTAASLILSLESAFAAISGALVLHESMTLRQLLGCAVIFCAVILSNLPEKQVKLPNEPK